MPALGMPTALSPTLALPFSWSEEGRKKGSNAEGGKGVFIIDIDIDIVIHIGVTCPSKSWSCALERQGKKDEGWE